MSWFTEETLCIDCHGKELQVRSCLPHGGRYFEGCGFIPETVGDTTVYANSDKVKPGDFVEVKYLYYNPGGALFQPVLLGKRDDVGQEDCTLKQLKPKKQVEENV